MYNLLDTKSRRNIVEFFEKAFAWLADVSSKLPKIDFQIFFIVVAAVLFGLGIVFAFTYLGSKSFKLIKASKKIQKYLEGVDAVDDDNVSDFTAHCFSAKAPQALRDSWVQYLGVRFGYPSDIVSDKNVYDKTVKKNKDYRAGIYICVSLILLAVFAFWGYGTLDKTAIGAVHFVSLVIIGLMYLFLILINRAQNKRCLEAFDAMQEDLDAKVNLQVEKNYATDSSPLSELAGMVEEIIARNTSKAIDIDEEPEEVAEPTPIEALIEQEEKGESVEEETSVDEADEPVSEDKEEEPVDEEAEPTEETSVEEAEEVEETPVDAVEENTEEVADEETDEVVETEPVEEAVKETSEETEEEKADDENVEETIEESTEEEGLQEAQEDAAEENAEEQPLKEEQEDTLDEAEAQEEVEAEEVEEEVREDENSVETKEEPIEEIADDDVQEDETDESEEVEENQEETVRDQSVDEEATEGDEEVEEQSEEEVADEGDAEAEEVEDDSQEDNSEEKAEEEPEVVYVVDGEDEDEEVVKPAKLVKLPNLVDYMLTKNMPKAMKIQIAGMLIGTYKKFENSKEDRKIVVQCLTKVMRNLQAN